MVSHPEALLAAVRQFPNSVLSIALRLRNANWRVFRVGTTLRRQKLNRKVLNDFLRPCGYWVAEGNLNPNPQSPHSDLPASPQRNPQAQSIAPGNLECGWPRPLPTHQ